MNISRVTITSNAGNGHRWGHATLRHGGTVQRMLWAGPIHVVVRNARAQRALKAAGR